MGETIGFGRAKKGASRPMRGEHGSYVSFDQRDSEPDVASSTVDASDFPTETHPMLHISERVRSKTRPALADVAATAELIAPHSTGYSVKHENEPNAL